MDILTWILLLVVVSIIALHFHISKHFGTLEMLGIPCVKPWPFIGSMAKELFTEVHHNDMKRYKKYGRIYGQYDVRTPTIRIGDPDILQHVLVKQFSKFPDKRHIDGHSDPMELKSLNKMRGDEWKQTRRVLSPAFTSSKLRQLPKLIEKCSIKLLERIEEKSKTGECFEAKNFFSIYLVDVMALYGFSIELNTKVANVETFLKYMKHFMSTQSPHTIAIVIVLGMPVFIRRYFAFPLARLLSIGLKFFKNLSYGIIKKRQASNERRNDLLHIMLDCIKDEQDQMKESKNSSTNNESSVKSNENQQNTSKKIFTVEDAVANVVMFLLSGFETVASSLANTAYCLATHPDIQDKLLNEVDNVLEKNEGKINHDILTQLTYMDMVIMEMLRLYPQLNRVERECLETAKIKDLIIPKGVLVVIPVYCMHRDEEFYPEPEKFHPERFSPENKNNLNPYTFYGFGHGPRQCFGMKLAMMELKLTLTHILRNYRFTCGPETQIPLKFKASSLTLSPANGIHICVEKRNKTI